MKSRLVDFLKGYDFSFLLAMCSLFLMGILNLYSATYDESTVGLAPLVKSQILWFFVALFLAVLTSFISPKNLFRYSYFFYFLCFSLLVMVMLTGKTGMGATRWLQVGPLRFQPSEFMKIALIFALARWYTTHAAYRELTLRDLILPGLIAFLPAALVIKQPDLGTGLMYLLIFLMISFYRRLKWQSILKLASLGVISAILMYNFALKDYQRKRVQMFLNPYQDAKGSGYNSIQSAISIGSGRLLGKGYRQSSQASLHFLPENHTDFVFSIFNEEHGFVGSIFLIGLYLLLLLRLLWLAKSSHRVYDSILTIGILSIFFWHIFINMAMVTGLMPIVGIPLPLMSYGGSSLVVFGILIGLSTSISNTRTIF